MIIEERNLILLNMKNQKEVKYYYFIINFL